MSILKRKNTLMGGYNGFGIEPKSKGNKNIKPIIIYEMGL